MSSTPQSAESQRAHFLSMLRQFRDGMLVTHGPDQLLHARPMHVAQVEDQGAVWLMSDLHALKVEELRRDARATVTMQDGGRFLALAGHAEVVRDADKVAALWSEPWRVWFPTGPADPTIALLKVVPEGGEYWDSSGVKGLKYAFAAAKAYATGDRPHLGREHQAKVDL